MNNDVQKRVEMATSLLVGRLKKWLPGMSNFDFLAAAFLLKEASKKRIVFEDYDDLKGMISGELANIIFNYSKVDVAWKDIKELSYDFDTEVFEQILKDKSPLSGESSGTEDIPEALAELCFRLLDIKDEDSLANINSRSGRLLVAAAERNPNIRLTAIEMDAHASKEIEIRSAVLGNTVSIENKKDVFGFAFSSKKNKTKKYNKIISTHPFGLRSRMISNRFEDVKNECPFIKTGTAADWLYCSAMIKLLEEKGVAVGLMSTGCLFTNQDKEARKHFLQCGYIKTVISLPARLFTSTGIDMALVVFSRGNETVRLVDAREMFVAGRRQNILSEDNLHDIMLACERDSKNSIVVDADQFAENEYVLLPERYLFKPGVVEDGKELEELVTFERGLIVKASQLDKMIAEEDEETGDFYLRLTEIKDGVIEEPLPKLKTVDKEYERYRLVEGDVILSRIGNPFKVAIYHQKADKKVYPVGNMYILRADPNKINPYYLKAFLESNQGIACLKNSLTGITVQVISLERLKKMVVPVPPLKKQELVARRYLKIQDEIETLRTKTKAAKERLTHVLDSIKTI